MLAATVTSGSPASAQILEQYDYENLEFKGIGVEGSRVWPSGVGATNGFGILLDLGSIGPRLRIVPAARYWASSLDPVEVERLAAQIILVCERQVDVTCPAELDLGEVKLSDLELAVDAHFQVAGVAGVSAFFGVGIALHLLNGRGDFIDGTFVEDLLDSVAPGLGPLGGVTARLSNAFSVGAQARFMLASDVRYASASLGAIWTLPAPRPTEPLDGRSR